MEGNSNGRDSPKLNGEMDSIHRAIVTFSLKDKKGALCSALKSFEDQGVNITHIESRPSQTNPGSEYDFYIDCTLEDQKGAESLKTQLEALTNTVQIHSNTNKGPWMPKQIKDLDIYANDIHYFGGELDPDHPGYNDMKYRERRKFIEQIALNYKHGDIIQDVEYTDEEIKTWGYIFREQTKRYPTHACKEYNRVFPLLVAKCGYSEDRIPQLQEISNFLKGQTGFQIRPVAGLVSPRQFLAGLAFRVYHSTQYIRHSSQPIYTPEPDICHELLGHVPMFCDPGIAEFSQELGLASLGAPDDYIDKLSTLYWFTLEFGVCKQDGGVRAYGAGLLSSVKELQSMVKEFHSKSDSTTFKPFNPAEAAVQKFPLKGVQPVYYLAESFQDACQKLTEWASEIPRPHPIHYDPYTQSIRILDNKQSIERFAMGIRRNHRILEEAITKL